MKRIRFPDDLFKVLEDEKQHRNENIGEVLKRRFPELEEEVEERESEEAMELDDDLLDTELSF